MSITKKDIEDTLTAVRIVAELIKAAGSIPSGHLYAAVNARGLDLRTYDRIIDMLVQGDIVTKKNHLLTWKGYHEAKQAE